jgi:inhibitor of cysteine peptidase
VTSGSFLVVPSFDADSTFAPTESLVTVKDQDVQGPYFVGMSSASRLISGTVSGAVKAGVKVALSGEVTAEVTTDSTGTYVFTDLVDGAYTVTASLDGFVFTPPSIAVTLSGTTPSETGKNFVASALTKTYAIDGTISGDVAAGVKVTLSGAGTAEVTSDGQGNYRFTGLANGTYAITPSAAGFTFAPASTSVVVAGANLYGKDFVSTARCTITGTVSGAVAGVTIDLTFQDAPAATTATDAAGKFRFVCPGDGSYMLFPSMPGYVFDPESRTFTVNGGASASGLDFAATAVPETYAIVGAISGDVISRVPVYLTGFGGTVADAMVRTDQDGNFAFTGLASGLYLVIPDLPGYLFTPWNSLVTVAAENVSGPFFVSAKAANRVISGQISGAIAAGVTVTLSGGAEEVSTTTAADGTYYFAGLADGSYTVTPSAPGYGFTPAYADVEVSGVDQTAVDFVSWVGYLISGVVTGLADGTAATLEVSGDATATTTTDEVGAYAFPVLPAGHYLVTPSLGGYSFSPATVDIPSLGADTALDFTATLYCVVSGDVFALGAPLPGVQLAFTGAGSGTATADDFGHYAFTCDSDGSYMIIPALDGYAFAPASQTLTVSGAPATAQDFDAIPLP